MRTVAEAIIVAQLFTALSLVTPVRA